MSKYINGEQKDVSGNSFEVEPVVDSHEVVAEEPVEEVVVEEPAPVVAEPAPAPAPKGKIKLPGMR